MPDLIVPNIICFQTQKKLATLNEYPKSVLIDLHARNFVLVKTSLCACCMHNLLSPGLYDNAVLIQYNTINPHLSKFGRT